MMPEYGAPGFWFDQFMSSWHQDWSDEYVNAYDAAEGWLAAGGEKPLRDVVERIDALFELSDELERRESVGRYLPFGAGQFDVFLRAARQRAEDILDGAASAPLQSPPELVFEGEEREGPYPELLSLARYVDRYVRGEQRSVYLDHGDREIEPGWAIHYRLSELAALYSRRLVEEVARLRAAEPDREGRLAAIGGSEIWDADQDPDEYLDFVELCARYKAQRGYVPSELGLEDLDVLRAESAPAGR